jgi:hypothetical protein
MENSAWPDLRAMDYTPHMNDLRQRWIFFALQQSMI